MNASQFAAFFDQRVRMPRRLFSQEEMVRSITHLLAGWKLSASSFSEQCSSLAPPCLGLALMCALRSPPRGGRTTLLHVLRVVGFVGTQVLLVVSRTLYSAAETTSSIATTRSWRWKW
jgi:hypothetical protein